MTRARFTQAEVERLLRAARRQGHTDPAVMKRADGSLLLLTKAPTPAPSDPAGDLDAEIAAWSEAAKRGAGAA